MFTGIITDVGKLEKRQGMLFTFKAPVSLCKKLEEGVSIAINGACLTVLDKPVQDVFSVEIMPETKKRTMLGNLKKDDPVNLELPATPKTYLSGHLLLGHIDGVARLEKIVKEGNSHVLKFSLAGELSKYIVAKGSVALNGISLTVIDVGKQYFTVGIIPYTWDHTMLNNLILGDLVNIELDILAKYVEKLLHNERH